MPVITLKWDYEGMKALQESHRKLPWVWWVGEDVWSAEKRWPNNDFSLPDINNNWSIEPKGGKDKKNGVCLCFALKHPFMKCGFCWR